MGGYEAVKSDGLWLRIQPRRKKNIAIIITFTIEEKKIKLEIRSYIKKKNEKQRETTIREADCCFLLSPTLFNNNKKKGKKKKIFLGPKRRRIIVRRKSPDTLHTKENWVFVFCFFFHMLLYRSHHHLPEAPCGWKVIF